MSEADGMDEAVEGGLRASLMAVTRIGEQLAKMREQSVRDMQQAEQVRARQLQEQFAAAQAAARAQLAPVSRDDWWDKASPEMIERVQETATAWKDYDPNAAEHAEQIRKQVQQRYGIDVDNPGASEQQISEAISRAQHARQLAEDQRSATAATHTDESVASAAVAGANRDDLAAAVSSSVEPGYDSPERRERLAQSLAGYGDREAVNVRLLAETHQGTHPSVAVRTTPQRSQATKAAKASGMGRGAERAGLER